jgi:endothelin-converting enzyme/putative endopeptidase
VLRIERALATSSYKREDRFEPSKIAHRFDRAALARLTPHFDWAEYFAALGLVDVTLVNVTEPKFFAAMDGLLARVTMFDLKAYLRWQAVHNAARYLASDIDAERFAFFEGTLRGVPQMRPRWQRCVGFVDSMLGEALGQEYVARTFGPKLKASTLSMTQQIEQAMHEEIAGLPWMGAATKRAALAKLAAISNKIGYPDRWRDYGPVVVAPDDFYGDAMRATEFANRRELAKIGKPVDRAEWGMTPQTVNAYYDWQLNDVNFPAAVLQPPLYDPALDDAPNYGDTGGTIGHELTHGFDNHGREFDASGNLKDWWTAADAREFSRRTQCIVDQYARYVIVDDIHINSRLTLGEDIADLGGLILAHIAWRMQTEGEALGDRDGLLCRLRAVGLCQRASRGRAGPRQDRPALPGALSRQRRDGQHAAVWPRVRVSGRLADGQEGSLRRLVSAALSAPRSGGAHSR